MRGVLGGANVCFPQLDLDTFFEEIPSGLGQLEHRRSLELCYLPA